MRVVLIHGSVGNASVWSSVRRELEPRFEVVTPTRGGYPPAAPLERIDFEQQARELAPELGKGGAHLVGHSYGGVIALLIAAAHPQHVRSLAVSEPPAFGLALGNPAVDELVARLDAHFRHGPREPRAFAEGFLALVGSELRLPDPLPPGLEQGIHATMAERGPWEAVIPLDELAAAPFPKLVVSGAHGAAFDADCDVLEQRLGAERAVLPGAEHSLMRAPGFAERLAGFLDDSVRTERSAQ
ncbi:MAG TPA: alpha/beta fold hydrolase [Gaiellaceae bacterium]|nr:alpha/beta fold hydrolase [Gaiellaceae bacterium]